MRIWTFSVVKFEFYKIFSIIESPLNGQKQMKSTVVKKIYSTELLPVDHI